jgi:hypothetical protein
MPTYFDLQLNRFYLVQEKVNEDIVLVQPLMHTNECVFLTNHGEGEPTLWRKKSEELFEVVEELNDEQLAEYEELFDDSEEIEWDEA